MVDNATVTIRVPRDLKASIDSVARELQISQSAVWKMLISHCLRHLEGEDVRDMVERVAVSNIQDRRRARVLKP